MSTPRIAPAYTLHDDTRMLRWSGGDLPLSPHDYALLHYLVEHKDRVISRAELMEAVWYRASTSDGPLHHAVQRLRSALQQAGIEGAIRGVARQGYQFCAEIALSGQDLDAGSPLPAPSPAPPPGRLPHPHTALIGRDAEVATAAALLADRACRLLLLTGPGGVGKTRLAIAAARRAESRFAQGAVFVDLQPVRSEELVPAAIAQAAGIVLQGTSSPRDQLLRFLRGGRRLLVLDNIEHVAACADLLLEITAEAPGVQMLVTSREPLGIGEQVMQVDALPLPPPDAPLDSPASRLFIERARHARQDFDPQAEAGAVAAICRLVGGIPLALELASGWAGVLTCGQIAAEIAHNLDFLSSNRRDIPERHRSMSAVFEHAWQRLRDEERQALARLAVFQGGFTFLEAREIAGAGAAVLRGLVDRSLLRARGGSRYDMHELVRQYAEGKLAEQGELAAARATHAGWFIGMLSVSLPGLSGADQRGTILRLTANLDNLRAAWRWAVEHRTLAGRADAIQCLAMFLRMTSRVTEGAAACHAAIATLEADDLSEPRLSALAAALCQAGWLDLRLGNFDQSWLAFRRAAALHRDHELPHLEGPESDPVLGLAYFAYGRGDIVRSEELSRAALDQAVAEGCKGNEYAALSFLGRVLRWDRRNSEAVACHTRAYALVLAAGNDWYRARVAYELGMSSMDARNYEDSRRYFNLSRSTFDDPNIATNALNGLGTLAIGEGDNATGERLFTQVAAGYRAMGDEVGLLDAMHCLARAEVRQGKVEAAAATLTEGLKRAAASGIVMIKVTLLVDAAEVLIAGGRLPSAARLLGLAEIHPTWGSREHGDIRRHLTTLSGLLPAEDLERALEEGRALHLDDAVSRTLADLVTIGGQDVEVLPLDARRRQATPSAPPAEPAAPPAVRTRVLLVDAHQIMREGLARLLADSASVEVIGTAATGEQALALSETAKPDVVLLDFTLPDMDGVEVARRLLATNNAVRVLMLTSISDERRVREAIAAGVTGYLLKDIGRAELVQAIEEAAAGRSVLHPAVRNYLLQFAAPAPEPARELPLSGREREILRLLAQGESNRAIAVALGLTHGTVKVYISGLLGKLGVADRTQAALYAVRHGLSEA